MVIVVGAGSIRGRFEVRVEVSICGEFWDDLVSIWGLALVDRGWTCC